MNSSREQILAHLKRDTEPFPGLEPVGTYRHMVPVPDVSAATLSGLFVREARKLACTVHEVATAEAAVKAILTLIGDEPLISSWDIEAIELPGLGTALAEAGITCTGADAGAQVGLTGVSAALAATGSLLLCSDRGQNRAASLLPPAHIAFVKSRQIVADMESWWAQQREKGLEQMRRSSNVVIVSGPSRTADIAMQPVMGMHGPGRLDIVLLVKPG